jgi:precorrin-6B methylase 2
MSVVGPIGYAAQLAGWPRRSSRVARMLICAIVLAASFASAIARDVEPYSHVSASPDGTGIVYMGRETAGVMGHEGAAWLERDERAAEERPDLLLRALALEPGMTVADIGAGTGYYSWRMAERVGPSGSILAVDVQPEMLALLAREMKRHGARNVTGILGTTTDPRLPVGAVDLVLMVDVYHEFDHPREMLDAIVRSLKPDGRVVFVEYRAEDASVPIKPHHKMSQAQVRKEAAAAGLSWRQSIETLPWQHIIVFGKAQ